MECKNCNSTNIGIRLDARGVASFVCEDCGAGLGKASSASLVGIIEKLKEDNKPREEKKRPPCKYCTEDYFFRQGRLGSVYIPVDNKFCPMCGREINREKDRGF